ncbi:4-(cytidine 5'-diphospho)-2-C-methyl-D-erythritol kinase [Paroceanicella profunda]|uniref:4-diphosphocytidyl-2-C-methyl-D-erythritol kinase n=1 Tax=Paroceanicella profunda TaxID=2579971 RepID=A0A5B8G365_9RHOB|nr:4-(cytidine 5'-diphospho)-2-C-methyl-D-erythritol kinase [Paroceanicella profunda]
MARGAARAADTAHGAAGSAADMTRRARTAPGGAFPGRPPARDAGPAAGSGRSDAPRAPLHGAGVQGHATPPRGARITLEKALPVASGIGGGSADAAATLRALCRLWRMDLPETVLATAALALGADLPVCLLGRSARMSGIGEVLTPAPGLPEVHVVLANPGVGVSTGAVFRGLSGFGEGLEPLPALADAAALAAWLARQRNDLEPPARALCPPIAETLDALAAAPGALLARMSGSGATCFALFAGAEAAARAAAALSAARPGWWVRAAPVTS